MYEIFFIANHGQFSSRPKIFSCLDFGSGRVSEQDILELDVSFDFGQLHSSSFVRIDVRDPVDDFEDGGGGTDSCAYRVHERQRVTQRKGSCHHAEEYLPVEVVYIYNTGVTPLAQKH